jgi:hypothetical protein
MRVTNPYKILLTIRKLASVFQQSAGKHLRANSIEEDQGLDYCRACVAKRSMAISLVGGSA